MTTLKKYKKLIQVEWVSTKAIFLVSLFTSATSRQHLFLRYLKIISKITTSSSAGALLHGNSPFRSPRSQAKRTLSFNTQESVPSKSDFSNLMTMRKLQLSNSLDSKATSFSSKIKSKTSNRPLLTEFSFDGRKSISCESKTTFANYRLSMWQSQSRRSYLSRQAVRYATPTRTSGVSL